MPADPELLSSEPAPHGRRGRLVLTLGVAAAGLVGLALLQAGRGPEATPPAGTIATTATTAAGAATSVAADDLLTGSRPVNGLPLSGNEALLAARSIVAGYCDHIDRWTISVESPAGDYSDVALLLTPSGPAYQSVQIRLRLTWAGDHYDWTGSRAELEGCP